MFPPGLPPPIQISELWPYLFLKSLLSLTLHYSVGQFSLPGSHPTIKSTGWSPSNPMPLPAMNKKQGKKEAYISKNSTGREASLLWLPFPPHTFAGGKYTDCHNWI